MLALPAQPTVHECVGEDHDRVVEVPVLLADNAERRSLLLLRRLTGGEAGRQVDDHHVGVCRRENERRRFQVCGCMMLRGEGERLRRTCALLGEAAGVPQQLEGLLEASRVLRGSVRSLDVGDEGAHLPLGLTGGRRQQALVALVQRAGANRFAHRQDGDLERHSRVGLRRI